MKSKSNSSNRSTTLPDIRADEPERAMTQFTEGLRRVLAAPKPIKRKRKRKNIT